MNPSLEPMDLPRNRKTVVFEIRNLDKGGLEQIVYNLAARFDYTAFRPIIVCVEDGGDLAQKALENGLEVFFMHGSTREYLDFCRREQVRLINSFYSDYCLDVAQELNIPVVCTIQNAYVWFEKNDRQRFFEQDKNISLYIAVSNSVSEYLQTRLGINKEKISVIPNCVDSVHLGMIEKQSLYITRKSLGLSEQDFVFLNVASMDGRKNQHLLISSLQRLIPDYPQLKVVCLGNVMDPNYYESLLQRTKKLGLEKHIIFPGFISNPVDLYRISNAFVLPSLVEGWSVAMTEALYFGLPLVLTDVGGAREVINVSDMGILVSNAFGHIVNLIGENLGQYTQEEYPSNLDQFVAGMKDILDRPDYWQNFALKRREFVLHNCDVALQVRQTEKVFQEIMA